MTAPKFRSAFAFIAASAFFAVPAAAVTTDGVSGVAHGDVVLGVNPVSSLVTEYTFDFSDNPSSQYVEFTTAQSFSVALVSFDDFRTGGSDVTGYILERVGGTRLTTDTGFCGGALAFSGPECNLIADADATGGSTGLATKDAASPVTLFSDLAAGTWRLGIFDSNTPDPGQAVFRVSEVPVPAGALMLVSALGLWRAASGRRET